MTSWTMVCPFLTGFMKRAHLSVETSQFVDQLFATLKSKSYKTSATSKISPSVPKAEPAHASSAASAPAPTASSSISASKDGGIPIPLDALLAPQGDARGIKRRLDSDGGPGEPSRLPPKGPRLRESTVSRYDTSNAYGRHESGTRGYRDERDRDRGRDRDGDRRPDNRNNGVRPNGPPTAPAADREDRRGGERDAKRQPCRDYHGESSLRRFTLVVY